MKEPSAGEREGDRMKSPAKPELCWQDARVRERCNMQTFVGSHSPASLAANALGSSEPGLRMPAYRKMRGPANQG